VDDLDAVRFLFCVPASTPEMHPPHGEPGPRRLARPFTRILHVVPNRRVAPRTASVWRPFAPPGGTRKRVVPHVLTTGAAPAT